MDPLLLVRRKYVVCDVSASVSEVTQALTARGPELSQHPIKSTLIHEWHSPYVLVGRLMYACKVLGVRWKNIQPSWIFYSLAKDLPLSRKGGIRLGRSGLRETGRWAPAIVDVGLYSDDGRVVIGFGSSNGFEIVALRVGTWFPLS